MERQEVDAFYNQTRLRSEAYPDSKNLVARADIYRFALPDIPFPSWALSHLSNNLGVVLDEAIPDTTATSPPKEWPEHRFDLEKGEGILGPHFDSVERFDLARELVVPEAEPVVRYLASTRSLDEERLPEGVTEPHPCGRLRVQMIQPKQIS